MRTSQKFLGWLAAAHNITFPMHWKHLVEYLQVRLSEPCVRGSLKLVHASCVFLQEAAGIQDRLTDAALHDVSKKELLASALPGKASASGSPKSNDTVSGFRRQWFVSGNADLLEGFILVAVASILGDAQI